MYKVRKGICMVMFIAFAAAMTLTGCGSQNTATDTASSGAATAAPVTTAEELKPVELNWYLPATPQKETQLVEQALDTYLKDKINATIKLNLVDWGSWSDKFPVLLASGENVDIMFTAGWSQYPQSVAKGYFADVTDMLDKYAPKTKANLPALLFEGAKINGKIFAIPTSKELAHTNGFLWNTAIAEKCGVEADMQKFQTTLPTLADLEPILLKVHAADPDIYPLEMSASGSLAKSYNDFDPVGDQNVPGMLYPNKDTKVIDEYETPEYKAVLEMVHKFYQEGLIRKDAPTLQDVQPDRKAQKVFLQGGTTKPLANEEVGTALGYKLEEFSYTKPFVTANDVTGSMNAVAAASQNKERALMFLELVNTDSVVNNTLNYGVENTHWVKKSDNPVVIDFAAGMDAKTTGYMPNAFWEFGNQFLNYFMAGQNTQKWDLFKQYNESGVGSKILGFNFDAEPVKTEIAAVTNVTKELGPALETGSVDPNIYLPMIIEKMKAAGLDKIIQEKQKQIDAWLAATGK
jgi:putative aldouronate transport system substrate-binding protein